MYKKKCSAPLALQVLITSVYLFMLDRKPCKHWTNKCFVSTLFIHFIFFFTCFILQISHDCFFNAGILNFKGLKSPPYSQTS